MKYYSNAKINLGLQIHNKRLDGFHNLKSIFIELDFHDKLIFSKAPYFKIQSNSKEMPLDGDNIISHAYNSLKKMFMPKWEYLIFVEKNIPMGSGLGGGSSNAATTLKALNTLWELNLSEKQLIDISSKIGSDVPFFINGKTQYVEGRGEKLSLLNNRIINNYIFLLVFPEFSISTKWAFSKLNIKKNPLFSNETFNKFCSQSEEIDWKFFKNDFEDIINQTYPEISKIKETLMLNGALHASLSGSGSTMFGVFDNCVDAEKASVLLKNYNTVITKPHK